MDPLCDLPYRSVHGFYPTVFSNLVDGYNYIREITSIPTIEVTGFG